MSRNVARALLEPAAVALIGASGDPAKNTGRPQRFLRAHGYEGRVVPVNPGRDRVQGEVAYPSVADAPGPIDHALIMVPRGAVADALRDCAAAGVPVATVYTDGFADTGTGAGREAQAALAALAGGLGVRVLGPNSMGVVNPRLGLTLSPNAVLEIEDLHPGRTALVSQSGSVIGSLLSRGAARGLGYSKLVSVGNEADLSVGEIVDWLVDDPATEVIALFLESLRGADRLALAARRAAAAGKPVVAYKLGRSEVGRRLAATHSGAMTGAGDTARAFFRAHGIVEVEQLETLVEIPPLLRSGPAMGPAQVAVMTTTGGGAATVVDRLGELGVGTVPAPASLVEHLRGIGLEVEGRPIVDLTMAGTRREVFEHALTELLGHPDAGGVVVVVGSSAQFHPELTVEPLLLGADSNRPFAVFFMPDAPRALRRLAEHRIAGFRTPEACAEAMRAALHWRAPRARGALPQSSIGIDSLIDGSPDGSIDGPIDGSVDAQAAGALDEARAMALLDRLGIETPRRQVLADEDTRLEVPCPVVLKVLSPDIAHKTEVGGVRLGLETPEATRAAIGAIRADVERMCPGARIEGYLAAAQASGLAEAIVAFRRDPEVGPMVSVGLGGRLTEIYRDFAVRLAPVSVDEALEMIGEVKGLAPIRGYRGLPRGDVRALADVVSRLSMLASPRVEEAELNPVIIRAEGAGAVAVDALVVLG